MAQVENIEFNNAEQTFDLIPVGINVGKKNVVESTLIKGLEDGENPINFDRWLIPFSEITKALNLQINILDNEDLELRNAGLVVRIKPEDLTTDEQLGLVISIQQIKEILAVEAEFDFISYAIQLEAPWLNVKGKRKTNEPLPIITEGLPFISAPQFTITSIGNELNYNSINNNKSVDKNIQGKVGAVGSLFGGSWYLSTNQSDLTKNPFGKLTEAQYLKQTPQADYVLGSHSTFWNSSGVGEYWGFTTIQRFGYTPIQRTTTGGFNARNRLQSDNVLQDITGKAETGTLVQLTKGFRDEVVAEFLVGESGEYTFANVPTQSRFGNNYRLLLYPDGILSNNPEIREVEFLNLPGQLSKGTSALILSTGLSRQTQEDDFIGDFSDWRGGVAYRRGLTDELTVGIGAVKNDSFDALGEIFYQPKGIPLKVGISGLATGFTGELDYDLDLQYQPSNRFNLSLQSDPESQRFQANLGLFPGLTLRARGDTRNRDLGIGFNISQRLGDLSFFGSAEYQLDSQFRFNLRSRLYNWELNYQQDEELKQTELVYNFSSFSQGYSLFLNYQTRNNNNSPESVITLGGEYISATRTFDGQNVWRLNAGYRMGNNGNGFVASASTGIIPSLDISLVYEQVSLFSDTSRLRVQFSPAIAIKPRLSPSEQRFDRLRTEGGIFVQPFIDQNDNGTLDGEETVYQQDLEILLILNNQPLQGFRPKITNQGIYANLPAGIHRLDLDPSGYPFDTTPPQSALAVEVVAGAYTSVNIPFSPSYTIVGVLSDVDGKPIAGARVEAVNQKTNQKVFSITNDAGVYFLEGLKKGKYEILVNNQSYTSDLIVDDPSDQLLEFNLKLN